MAQDNPNRRVSTNPAASASVPKRSRLYTRHLQHPHQPVQHPLGTSRENEAPSQNCAEPKHVPDGPQKARNSTRGGILLSNLNHFNHRRHVHSEKADNSYPLRKGYSAADPRRKWGKAKKPAVKPDVVRPYKKTAPMQLRKCCSVSYECCQCNNGTVIKRTAHNPDRAYQCEAIRAVGQCGHRWCPKCPVIREEWVEDALEKGVKGGKRSHDRRPRPKYVMPAATE